MRLNFHGPLKKIFGHFYILDHPTIQPVPTVLQVVLRQLQVLSPNSFNILNKAAVIQKTAGDQNQLTRYQLEASNRQYLALRKKVCKLDVKGC